MLRFATNHVGRALVHASAVWASNMSFEVLLNTSFVALRMANRATGNVIQAVPDMSYEVLLSTCFQ